MWEGRILGGCRDSVEIEVNNLVKCPKSTVVTYWVSPWPRVPFEVISLATWGSRLTAAAMAYSLAFLLWGNPRFMVAVVAHMAPSFVPLSLWSLFLGGKRVVGRKLRTLDFGTNFRAENYSSGLYYGRHGT